MPLRALIVDDEPLGRRGIRVRLDRAGDVSIIGECSTGREAVTAILNLAPDVVFLDIQMPGLDGFGVVDAVGPDAMPTTVFVTAFDQHALKAFEARALDYLLKPIDDDRFEQSLERARRQVSEQRQKAPEQRSSDPSDVRFLADRGGRIAVVRARDIDWIEAAGDYIQLHVAGSTYLLRDTMRSIEKRLNGGPFIRVHRSSIVHIDRIQELRPLANREYVIVLDSGSEVRMSRNYRERLAAALGVDL